MAQNNNPSSQSSSNDKSSGGRGGRNRKRRPSGGRRRRKRRSDGQNKSREGGGGSSSQRNAQQADTHPLDPIQSIKVKKNAAEPNRDPGRKILFDVMFFDTIPQAMGALEKIKLQSEQVGQLNIVIKAEADRNLPELTQYGKVFCGEAWTIIHQRRVDDGWYQQEHEAYS